MVILRFRTKSDANELLKKLKKMHKFTKELVKCVEDKIEEDEEDEDYRYDDDDDDDRMERISSRSKAYRSRYRRSM